MPEDPIIVVFDPSDIDCEECGGEFVESSDDAEMPVLFNQDCEIHVTHTVVFHRRCLPPDLAEQLHKHQSREAARLGLN